MRRHRALTMLLAVVLLGGACAAGDDASIETDPTAARSVAAEGESPVDVLDRVLTTPLDQQFERAHFQATGVANDGVSTEALTGTVDLAADLALWHRGDEPTYYREGPWLYERREADGEVWWWRGDYDPASFHALLLPWPGPLTGGSAAGWSPADMVVDGRDAGVGELHGEPVRELVFDLASEVGSSDSAGQPIDQRVELAVDTDGRPRRIGYSVRLGDDEIPIVLEFWDIDGAGAVVDEPADLDAAAPD